MFLTLLSTDCYISSSKARISALVLKESLVFILKIEWIIEEGVKAKIIFLSLNLSKKKGIGSLCIIL